MTFDSPLGPVVDELANSLQAVILIAEHLRGASAATAQDADALLRSLKRATDALQRLRAHGGDR